jgi:hypothetical protein
MAMATWTKKNNQPSTENISKRSDKWVALKAQHMQIYEPLTTR